MQRPDPTRYTADAQGVTIRKPDGSTEHWAHEAIAVLSDYEAVRLGLPRHVAAVLVVRIEGRIDRADFNVQLRVEPLHRPQPWTRFMRTGVLLTVGTRVWRLNANQLAVWNAVETMHGAGADVAARLRCWPALSRALLTPQHARVLVQGVVPSIHVVRPRPQQKPMTRNADGQLEPMGDGAPWGVLPGRKYVLPV